MSNEAKNKTRQPLSETILVVASKAERTSLERFAQDIKDELNVVALTFTEEPAKYVDFQLLPNFRVLGPKLGQKLPECKKALGAANGSELHAEMAANGKIVLALPSGPIELGPDEIEVRLVAKADFRAASSAGRVVVLDTRITDELKRMGFAREVVSRIQRIRKGRDYAHEARIHVLFEAEGELGRAIEEHSAYVAGEVLATSFARGAGAGEPETADVDGSELRFWVELA